MIEVEVESEDFRASPRVCVVIEENLLEVRQ